jgi:hypothetical protein
VTNSAVSDAEDAEAWQAWLIQHELNALQIVCPQLRYDDRTGSGSV